MQQTKMQRQSKTVIYVNYSPYENSGKILDYLLENYTSVFLFSIGFYKLDNKKTYNTLSIYKNGKLTYECSMYYLSIPQQFVFLLLPLRSFINFLQICIFSFWLKNKFGKIDIYFSVNAFTAWVGNILKNISLVKKTVFWVWDYYPPIHQSRIITLIRYIYWQFDKIGIHSDRIAFVSRKLFQLRKDMGITPDNLNYLVIPIGADKFSNIPKRKVNPVTLGFIGVLKKSQGLDVIFDNGQKLASFFPNIKFEVIGSGPDEKYFKLRASKSPVKTKFYGYLEGESFNDVLRKCTIGIATYIPDPSNVSYYGDPGKVKRYLSLGIPVITTDVSEFSKELVRNHAGVVIDINKPEEIINAIKVISANYKYYSKNAMNLSNHYYYKKIYPEMFRFQKPL